MKRRTHTIYFARGVWVRDLGYITWGVRDREAANAGVASASGIRQRFGGSTALTAEQESFRKFRRRSRHHRVGLGPGHLGLAGKQSRCGSGDRGSCGWTDGARGEGPLAQGPSRSVGPGGRPLVGPGGWAPSRCLRTASGSVGPRWCKANEGALLLRYVWSWRGARRARGEHSTDGHKTGWADVRLEPAARESSGPDVISEASVKVPLSFTEVLPRLTGKSRDRAMKVIRGHGTRSSWITACMSVYI